MLSGRYSPQSANERAGRPVPERIILGGRYSPQSPNERAGRPVPERNMLGGWYNPQSTNERAGRPVPERNMLGGWYIPRTSKQINYLALKTSHRIINFRCDEVPCYLVSLSHEKGCLLTAQPLITWTKKGKPKIILKRPPNLLQWKLKIETPLPPQKTHISPKCRKWRGGVAVIKSPMMCLWIFT